MHGNCHHVRNGNSFLVIDVYSNSFGPQMHRFWPARNIVRRAVCVILMVSYSGTARGNRTTFHVGYNAATSHPWKGGSRSCCSCVGYFILLGQASRAAMRALFFVVKHTVVFLNASSAVCPGIMFASPMRFTFNRQ